MSQSPSTKKKTRYHHGDLRQALLDEGSKMLEEVGIDGISLRGLARRLGVSHAAPAHHFRDRDTLLAELAADGFVTLHQALEAAMTDGHKPWVAAGQAYVDVALLKPETFKLMFGGLSREDCPPRLTEESTRAYLALLEISGVEVDPEIDVNTAVESGAYQLGVAELRTWALVHGAATLYLDQSLGVDEHRFRQLVAEMLDTDHQ